MCLRLSKGRRERETLPAGDRVLRQSRNLELLLALGVELGQFGDRRRLSQQADIVKAALVERPGRPARMRRPADLALDLVDEFLYAPCRRVCLLLLNAQQGLLMLLVRKPEIERAVDNQRHPNERDKQ